MPTLEFVTQSNRDSDNEAVSSERLVNVYPEPVTGGVARFALKSVLGLQSFSNPPDIFGRAMTTMNGVLYAAIGGSLYSIAADGTATSLGSIKDSAETSMAGNNGTLAIAAAGTYYAWDGTTLTTPTGGAFTDVGSVEFLGQYTIMTERKGRRVQWSGVADPTSLNGLDFATTEARDDDNLRVVAVNGNLMIFKERSTEIWYQVPGGSTSNAFARLSGGVLDTGLMGYNLVATFDGGAFFIGDDGIVYITTGAGASPVSTPPVSTSIEMMTPTHCFVYEDEGHKFCVIRFDDRPAWVYDISTGLWHERASGKAFQPWSVRTSVNAYNRWLALDEAGRLFEFARSFQDEGEPLVREIISRTLSSSGRRFRVPEIEFMARVGRTKPSWTFQSVLSDDTGQTVLQDDQGRLLLVHGAAGLEQNRIMLSVSGDNGQTWSTEREIFLGALGDYDKRVIQRALGQFRQATVRVRMTDPVNVAIYSAANVRLS